MAYRAFDYSLDFRHADFREHPELYRVDRSEQGVLLVEPYKSEPLPHWRFRTAAAVKRSSVRIYRMFLAYLRAGDFPDTDRARKFLQTGWTRSRRYANPNSGRKYDRATGGELQRATGAGKTAAAVSTTAAPLRSGTPATCG